MKLFLSFILLEHLVGLIFTELNFNRRYLGINKNAYDFFKSKVPKNIKDALVSLNELVTKHKANANKMDKFKGKLYKFYFKLSSNKMDKLLNTEKKVMRKHYEILHKLEETQHELSKALQETKGAIEYDKDSGYLKYNERSQVTYDILKPLRTYLPFQSAISLQSLVVGTTLSLEQKKMISKYDKAMNNILSRNIELNMLKYCNDFVLDNLDPNLGLNQMKNKMLSPAIISVSESQQKLIEDQKKLLGIIEQFFPHIEKYKLIHHEA